MRRLLRAITSIQLGVVIFGAVVSLVISAALTGCIRFLFFIFEAMFGSQDWDQAAVDRLASALDEARETVAREQRTVASIPEQSIDDIQRKAHRQAAQQRVAQTAMSLMNTTLKNWAVHDMTWLTSMIKKLPFQLAMAEAFCLFFYLLGAIAARVAAKGR